MLSYWKCCKYIGSKTEFYTILKVLSLEMDPHISDREYRKLRRNAIREHQIQESRDREMEERRELIDGNEYSQDNFDRSNIQLPDRDNSLRDYSSKDSYRRGCDLRSNVTSSKYVLTDSDTDIESYDDITKSKQTFKRQSVLTDDATYKQNSDDVTYKQNSVTLNKPADPVVRHRSVDENSNSRNMQHGQELNDTSGQKIKSVSFATNKQTIVNENKSYENPQSQSIDDSVFNLTEEMTKLDRKLSLLKQSNEDILKKSNVLSSTRCTDPLHDDYITNQENQTMNYPDVKRKTIQNERVESNKTNSDIRRHYENSHKELQRDIHRYGAASANTDTRESRAYQHYKTNTHGNDEIYRDVDYVNDNARGHGLFTNMDRTDTVQHKGMTGRREVLNDEDYEYQPRPHRNIKQEGRRRDNEYYIDNEDNDSVCVEQGRRLRKEEEIQREISRERQLLQRLYEEDKRIELERQSAEEEEERIMRRIHGLRIAEEELEKQRKEREYMQREIEKKLELENLRTKRLALLRTQEEELSFMLRNKRQEPDIYDYDKQLSSEVNRYTDMTRDCVQSRANEPRQAYNRTEENINSHSGFGKPKIPPFDGTDFKVWKIEVECIIKSKMYPESLIAQTMRNSLKGQTRKVLLTIDPIASSSDILRKLEDIYGNTQTEDSIMQDFFNAKQDEKETTSNWALRLETIMQLAIETGEISKVKKNSLLKQRFWKGLKSEKLRNNTRVTYESSANFEVLRKKARIEEEELKRNTDEVRTQTPMTNTASYRREIEGPSQKDITLQQQNLKPSQSNENEQMKMMQKLMDKMGQLEKEIAKIQTEHKQYENTPTNYRAQQFEYPPSQGFRSSFDSYRGNFTRGSRTPYYRPYRRPFYRNAFDQQSHRYKGPLQSSNSDKETSNASDRKTESKVEKKTSDTLNQ